MRKLALIALLAALLQNAAAQRMGGAPHFGTNFGANFGSQRSAFGSRSFAYPIPFFSDSLYSDAAYPPGYAPQAPTIIVMQAASAAEPERVQPPSQPLLIELQGDRYVRLSGEGTSEAELIDRDKTDQDTAGGNTISRQVPETRAMMSQATPRVAPAASAPSALVFRDGHREEVGAYTITDGVLYATGGYYTGGAWSMKVELSSLNLPETVAANLSRGMRFQIPNAPNEVIVGP